MDWEWSCKRCGYQKEFCKCVDLSVLEAEQEAREKERTAWARLAKATRAKAEQDMCGLHMNDETDDEYVAARQALCDLGVPVDALPEDR